MRGFITLLLLPLSLLAAVDVHVIAKKIDALAQAPNDSGVNYKVYDPFKRAKPLLAKIKEKPKAVQVKPIVVETILNEKALIDGKWMKKGSKIGKARVVGIGKHAIMVKIDDKELVIPQRKPAVFVKTREVEQ